jgi:MacB-like periplasmic core domain/FtsX-like permease family
MGSLWLVLRAELRHRLLGMLGLAMLLGLIGGVVLAAAAGARRTDTAYPRLLQWGHAAELQIWPDGTGLTGYYDALGHLPQVASMSTVMGFNMALPVRHGVPDTRIVVFSSPDGALGVSADRVKIVAGRLSDPEATDEAMVDEQFARREHLRPGSILHLLGAPTTKQGALELGRAVPLGFRVSAIVSFDDQIVPANVVNGEPLAVLSQGYSRTPGARSLRYGDFAGVRLRPGASVAAFTRAATALAAQYPATDRNLTITNLADEFSATERAIRPEAAALAIFAALTAVSALVVTAPLLSRQLIMDTVEFPILRALGMTRRSLAGLSMARVAVVTVGGACIAVVIAITGSPLMPIGPARLAEPSPGVDVNLAILAAGFAAVALLPAALVAPIAWRTAAAAQGPPGGAEPPRPRRASPLASALRIAGPVTGRVGVRMALRPGRGRSAVPVRSALVGITVAVTAIVAAVVFGTSLIRLIGTPQLYGQDWNQELDLAFAGAPAPLAAKIMSGQHVTAYAGGDYGQVRIDGRAVPAIGIDSLRGRRFLTLLAGRPPTGPGEIVLGIRTMHAAGHQIGQTIPVLINGTRHRMRIVGVAVFAFFSQASVSATDLGDGALVSARLLSVPFPSTGCGANSTCYNFFLIRYQPGTNLAAAAARITRMVTASGAPPGSFAVTADQRPTDIRDYADARDTPLALGAVLALLAVATLAHVLRTGVRRRRRDLAVLKALGLVRPQVLAVVAWQASALMAVALILGLPLGVIAGRSAWAVFAGSVGVAGNAEVPVPIVLLTIPIALLVSNLVAAGPGWAAAQIRPALILRSE